MKTFRDFMETSLYAPDGYYPNRVGKEDFFTAPELHPVFSEILAEDVVARLHRLEDQGVPAPYSVVEMGSGNGLLSRKMAAYIGQSHPKWAERLQWVLVERCESLMLESLRSFGSVGGKVLGYTRIEDVLPCSGVFLSNELVDAFPVHLLERRDGRMWEVYVQDGESVLGNFSRPELISFAESIYSHLPEGGRHCVNLEALAWIRNVSKVLKSGFLATLDYGRRYCVEAPNEPRNFYRHTTSGDVLARPGRQDLTASVDFEPLISEGEKCGLELESYGTLGRFLLDRGMIDRLARSCGGDDARQYAERNQMKTLLHPDGMGEIFKVLIQKKGLPS